MLKTDQTVNDNITGLTWEGLVDRRMVGQDDAARYCAGQDHPVGPWRLPTLLELISLVDYTVPSPGPTIRADFPDRPADMVLDVFRAPLAARPQGWYVDFARGGAHHTIDR